MEEVKEEVEVEEVGEVLKVIGVIQDEVVGIIQEKVAGEPAKEMT